MDANGTRYHLLLGCADWSACLDSSGAPLDLACSSLDSIDTPDPCAEAAETLAGGNNGFGWNQQHGELSLRPLLFQFVAAKGDTPPNLSSRRGAARDRYGNWYWIGDDKMGIYVNSSGTGSTSRFWPPEDGAECAPPKYEQQGDFTPRTPDAPLTPLALSGLAVTDDHFLVVGVTEPPGMLVFDLYAGGTPRQLLWPQGVNFAPFDMSPRPGGGVWVLDQKNSCYWALDQDFNIVRNEPPSDISPIVQLEDFQPTNGPQRRLMGRSLPEGIPLGAGSPTPIADPIAIEGLPDGTVLILDRKPDPGKAFSMIYRFRFGQALGQPVSTNAILSLIEPDQQGSFTLIGYDFAFVPADQKDAHTGMLGALYVAEEHGNQSYAFDLCDEAAGGFKLLPRRDYLPMRLFAGKGLVAADKQVYYEVAQVESGERWVPLVEQRRPRYVPEATLRTPLKPISNTDLTKRQAFDGREPDCVWHRLTMDGCIPPGTEVIVRSRAANDVQELVRAEWFEEPHPRLRATGSERPYSRYGLGNAKDGSGTWELLFQRARGRYLQLELRLIGTGRTTPRIRALRAYYPRFSYLDHYLPAVYREDPQPASFLDRFLANLEGFYTSIEDKIAAVQTLFDVDGAPPDALAWLADWFGVALDPNWDEAKKRLFIKHAPEFFQYRGTIRGLQMALRLAVEDCAYEDIFSDKAANLRPTGIRIVEKYRTRNTPAIIFGDPTDMSGLREVSPASTFDATDGHANCKADTSPRWTPNQRSVELNRRYTTYIIGPDTGTQQPIILYPLQEPAVPSGSAWRQFSQDVLGFVPSSTGFMVRQAWQNFLAGRYASITALNAAHGTSLDGFDQATLPGDLPSSAAILGDWNDFSLNMVPNSDAALAWQPWKDFLSRRYSVIGALNTAYNTRWSLFASVPPPDDLPKDGVPLLDWYQYEAVALPMRGAAHQFRVMLPVVERLTEAKQQELMDKAQRIINLEKPAHTFFDVKFYWAMFRVGEARLGENTLIDQGGRAPQLMPPMLVGQGYLAEGYLASTPAQAAGRHILNCEQLAG